MSQLETMVFDLPADVATELRHVVETGEFASPDEVVTAALADWRARRACELDALKADIRVGLADLAEGRVHAFDADRIAARGRALLAARSRSA